MLLNEVVTISIEVLALKNPGKPLKDVYLCDIYGEELCFEIIIFSERSRFRIHEIKS